jgi:hypothetical protein
LWLLWHYKYETRYPKRTIICLPGGSVLLGEDGEDELLSARLWMGTYNPGEEDGDESFLDATLIVMGADIFDG